MGKRDVLPETRIREGAEVMTLVNVFRVSPERQEELVQVLIEATEETMRHIPGFVSANIHRSLDGTRVVNYAQWRSLEDFQAMLEDDRARPHMQKAGSMAEYDPVLCEVAHVESA